jgi:hypothetical protein
LKSTSEDQNQEHELFRMSRFCILPFFFLEIECQIFFSMICSIGNLLTLVFSICETHSMASIPSTDATGVALVWSGRRAMVSDLWTVSQAALRQRSRRRNQEGGPLEMGTATGNGIARKS